MAFANVLPAFISSYLAALALILAIILAMVTGEQKLHRISGWIFAPAGLIGLALYLSAFLYATPRDIEALRFPDALLAVVRAVYATCGMFIGRQAYDAVERLIANKLGGLPALGNAVSLVFWLVHSGALFVTASAALSSLGKRFLQTLRVRALSFRRVRLYMIFGMHEESLTLGRDLVREKNAMVLYVDVSSSGAMAEQAVAFGAMVRRNTPLLVGDEMNERLMRLAGIKEAMRIHSAHILILPQPPGSVPSKVS